jgi:predicted nucleic acid-binding protein
LKTVVVDAAFVVHALVTRDGALAQWTERILERATTLLAPHLLHVEVVNALRRMHKREEITLADMRGAVEDMMVLGIQLEPFEPHAKRVLELVHNVKPYDAWYVAIAETWGVPLATGDRKLKGATGPRCAFLVP